MTVIGSLGRDLPEVKSSVNQYISAYINGNLGGVMKRIVLGGWLLLATSGSIAQTFACQFVASGGLDWKSSRWVATEFNSREPFFFKITPNDGMNSFKGDDSLERLPLNCDQEARKLKIHSCSTAAGVYVYFWEITQRGAISRLFGSAMEKDERDSLTVSPFICQKM